MSGGIRSDHYNILIEGCDLSGKTTLIESLRDQQYYTEYGKPVNFVERDYNLSNYILSNIDVQELDINDTTQFNTGYLIDIVLNRFDKVVMLNPKFDTIMNRFDIRGDEYLGKYQIIRGYQAYKDLINLMRGYPEVLVLYTSFKYKEDLIRKLELTLEKSE